MRYETKNDLAREAQVINAVSNHLGYEAQKLDPHLYGADFVMYSPTRQVPGMIGAPKIWAEVKCRNTDSTSFPHYMISLGKLNRLRLLKAMHPKTEAMIIVRFKDVTLYCDVNVEYVAGVGKRADMRCEYDLEPMAYIEMSNFNRF